MLKFLLTLMILLSLSLNSIVFSGSENIPLNKNFPVIQNLMIKRAEKLGLQNLEIKWKNAKQGNYVAIIIYNGKKETIPFSGQEIKDIQSNQIQKETSDKINSAINILKTGNKGPEIRP